MMMRRILFSTVLLALTPLVPALSNDEVKADTRVSISIGGGIAVSPGLVVGFSYNDPYVLGHVHRHAVACAHGPLYYYPRYKVYGHYHPRYSYTYYKRPYDYRCKVGHKRHGHRHHVTNGHRGRWGRRVVVSNPPRHRHDDRYDRGRYDRRRDDRWRDDRRGDRRDDRRHDRRDDRRDRHGERDGQRIRGH